MKREVELYFFAVLLLGIVFLLVFFQTGLTSTGLAVFDQQDQTGFDLGTYNNLEYNGSSVVLSVNQTTGTYTSQVFNAGNDSTWNNLTWTGQGDLAFEVKACSSLDCNESFEAVADLDNLITFTNLTSQYFQYRVFFTEDPNLTISLESVSVDYSVLAQGGGNSLPTLTDQSVQTDENSNIQLTLSGTDGDGDSLVFSIVDIPSNGGLSNVTQVDNSSASVTYTPNTDFSGDDSFTFKANDGTGDSNVATASINVVVISVEEETTSTEETTEETTTEEIVDDEPPPVQPTPELSIDDIQPLTLNPGDSEEISVILGNSGTAVLSSCVLTVSGSSSEWISYSQDSFNLNGGAETMPSLNVSVPEDVEQGEYFMDVLVSCSQITKGIQITLNVVEKTFEFNLTDVRKIRDDEVRVTYLLTDLSESDQTINLKFALFDNTSQKVSEITDTQNLTANETEKRFRTVIPINETIEGNLTIQADINSQVYSSSVNEAIVLRAPSILGFVTFDQIGGTGGLIVLVVSILAIVAIIFISRTLRKSKGMTTK